MRRHSVAAILGVPLGQGTQQHEDPCDHRRGLALCGVAIEINGKRAGSRHCELSVNCSRTSGEIFLTHDGDGSWLAVETAGRPMGAAPQQPQRKRSPTRRRR
jgi:hypothetical protein